MHTSFNFACGLILFGSAVCASTQAAERPTMNITRDPRPDILAHPFYYAHTEYRRQYNRPRFLTGWIASGIAPSSQEAMVWQENLQAGRYDEHHMPPMCKYYYAPKPWEVLQTGARPDTHPTAMGMGMASKQPTAPAVEAASIPTAHARAARRISDASPSDRR